MQAKPPHLAFFFLPGSNRRMLTAPLLAVTFTPLMFAAVLAWILSVCIHEFSHALVAYWGGDRSVREKGYLSLDPTKFIDPVFSLLLPAIILMMGGFPLPGGSVMIDRSALRNEKWSAYVSAAGPVSNFLLFLLLCIPIHPIVGIVPPIGPHPTWVYFTAAMAVLNFTATIFNLIPIPPLDGFGIIEHTFDAETRWKMHQPHAVWGGFGLLMFLLFVFPESMQAFFWMLDYVCDTIGMPFELLAEGFNFVMFDVAPSGMG